MLYRLIQFNTVLYSVCKKSIAFRIQINDNN
jgi:hypothetical protein